MRLFQYLNTSIHTREGSTLTVATLATSVSVVCLPAYLGQKVNYLNSSFIALRNNISDLIILNWWNANLLQILAWVGLLFPLLGNIYREITIFAVDLKDYRMLRRFLTRKTRSYCWIPRAIIIRTLLYSPAIIWHVSESLLLYQLNFIYTAFFTILPVIVTIIEYAARENFSLQFFLKK